jgi:hypothetical protein
LKPDLVARIKVIRYIHDISMTTFIIEALVRLLEEEEAVILDKPQTKGKK